MKYINRTFFKELKGLLSCSFRSKSESFYDLVIIRLDGIGDYVIWHDTIAAYKTKYPNAKVLFICDKSVHSLANQEEFFSTIISFKRTEVNNLLYTLKKISARTVINPMRERPWFADLTSMAISSSSKIAFERKNNASLFGRIYDRSYSSLFRLGEEESELVANEMFTKSIVDELYNYGCYPLSLKVEIPQINSPYVVVAFSSSTHTRNWPIENFISIINIIPKNNYVVLTGAGDQDMKGAQQIVEGVLDKHRIVNLVNKTSMPQVAAIISHSRLVIGNDSSAVHIAAAVRVPSIAITPGAHYGRFLPYPESIDYHFSPYVVAAKMDCFKCNYNCIYKIVGTYKCIQNVSVEMVCEVLQRLHFI